MEALIAVGLAGNVVQFVQGAGTLITFAKSMRQGQRVNEKDLPNLRMLSEDLTSQAAILKSRLKASSATLTEEDQNLLDVASECEEAGNTFVIYLNSLVSNSSNRTVGLLKTIIKLGWASPKIDDFTDKLDKLRSSLTLATVLALRRSAASSNDEILVHLRELQSDSRACKLHQKIDAEALVRLISIIGDQSSEKLNDIQGNIHANDACNPYFINGKAGSGKSTLMKFIYGYPSTEKGSTGVLLNPSTQAALKVWAGKNELVVLNFFFWNLGTELQKSHSGMMRSLLYAVLEGHPELIPAVFPRLYRNWKSSESKTAPEYTELKQAFQLMIAKAEYLRLAIFIDGIDEFEGDHRDITLFLCSMVSSRIKLIVSSRPLNPCLSALADCPTLRLQDLTRRDMDLYVQGELAAHPLMLSQIRKHPEKAPKLCSSLADKAEGVFLWVKLVVRLLIEGLEDGDDITELQARLKALPSGLKDLYSRMFEKMEGDHRKQGSVIFQLLKRWNDTVHEHQLPGLVLSYAICQPSAAFDLAVEPLSDDDFDWTMSSVDKRIRSRCCGLLELRYDDRTSTGQTAAIFSDQHTFIENEVGRSYVTYLHRTVAEFITTDEVWKEIRCLTESMKFDPSTNLASACLSILKIAKRLDDSTLQSYLAFAIHFCRTSEEVSSSFVTGFLQALDRTMAHLQKKAFIDWHYGSAHVDLHWSTISDHAIFKEMDTAIQQHASVYSFAARRGLYKHPIPPPADSSPESRFAVVVHAMWSWKIEVGPLKLPPPSANNRSIAFLYLLKNYAGLESVAFGTNLWQHTRVLGESMVASGLSTEVGHLCKTLLNAVRSLGVPWQVLEDAKQTFDFFATRCPSTETTNARVDFERISIEGRPGIHTNGPKRSQKRNGRGRGYGRSKKVKIRNER
ncbi:hypothetical protein FB567DRAFT_507528 [Paraphoma chrysanthemicola]|uniref:NACHT domain-containing protein n=1 Tax=Paraphoma chrysanthemicola TaxID=798071 RepID=A0A8K0QV87_9PLEO|nr:hypothetical protein FB567DRAFT_507528 [Paraphoma chrysanthemicola]